MPIGHRHGPGLLLGVVAFQQPGGTAPRRAAYLRRLAAFPAYLDALAANAREGLAGGVVTPRAVVARTIGQVDRLLATPVADSPALAPLAGGGNQERSRGVEALPERVYPAYARFLEVLRDYLPRAQKALGLGVLPGGEETYRSEILGWTTMPLEPDAAHQLGREHLRRARLARPPVAELLAAFVALRTANLVLIRETPVAWWDRLGIHEERGPTSFRLATETIAGHDRAHLLQLDQTITALQH